MPVTLDLESVPGAVIGVARGDLTLPEIKDSAATAWRLVEGPDVRMLWDLRDARFSLAPGEVRDLAEFVKQAARSPGARVAFVVSGDLEFGLIRMFEVYRDEKDTSTSVFRDRDQAVAWLAGGAG